LDDAVLSCEIEQFASKNEPANIDVSAERNAANLKARRPVQVRPESEAKNWQREKP
jgi:hypothetical protein